MRPQSFPHLRRSLLSIVVLGSVAIPLMASPSRSSGAMRPFGATPVAISATPSPSASVTSVGDASATPTAATTTPLASTSTTPATTASATFSATASVTSSVPSTTPSTAASTASASPLAQASATPSAVASATSVVQPSATATLVPTVVPAPPVGSDLWHLDEYTEHYIQAANNLTDLQLYNSPVGLPDRQHGWHVQSLRLSAPAAHGTVSTAGLSFALRLATTSSAATLASLTNEDGVTLGLGLPSAATTGSSSYATTTHVGSDAVTYTVPLATASGDVVFRPTIRGLTLRLVLHSAQQNGPFVVTLRPDLRTQLAPDAGGAIRVTRIITGYSDTGAPAPLLQTEYVLQAPSLSDSSSDPAAPAQSGPVTMSLAPTPSGAQSLTLRPDPTWLHDPRRVFPVRLDLPIVTGYAATHSGWFGTVASCAPQAAAPATDAVVGVEGRCTYHGEVYFRLASLMYDTPIVSATLNLYTPDHTGPTGVRVYPNTPPNAGPYAIWQPASWQPPSWRTAPSVVAGAPGVAQSASDGHWQRWDVTALVKQWVRSERTNGGLTLEGSGAPVRFAAPWVADPALAPYLDITYAPRPAISPAAADNATFIYGISGTFAFNSGCNAAQVTCSLSNGIIGPKAGNETVIQVQAVANGDSDAPAGPGGSYMRIGVTLSCDSSTPGYPWWNSSDQSPTGHYPADSNGNQYPKDADPYNINPILAILGKVASINNAAGNVNHLIPIVDLVPNGHCTTFSTPGSWYSQLKDFVSNMAVHGYGVYRPIYYEIGNEENNTFKQYSDSNGNPSSPSNWDVNYSQIFASSAQALMQEMNQLLNGQQGAYHILVGGMLQPSATADGSCTDGWLAGGANINILVANEAILTAEQPPYNVPQSLLGVAVHPYAYTTNNPSYWRNYSGYYGHTYIGPCKDLNSMLGEWVNTYFPGMPVVFTEINWQAVPSSQNEGAIGSYLVDLFTWVWDKPALGSGSYANPSSSPIRVAFFRGNDADLPLGIYYAGGTPKNIYIYPPNCTGSGQVIDTEPMRHDYYWLRYNACY